MMHTRDPHKSAAAANRRLWRHFWPKTVSARFGISLILFWIAVAMLAPWISPYPPNAQDMDALSNLGPSATHWLGTDLLGRDILSRILWGARTTLIVVPIATASAFGAGTAIGLASGYFGGIIDRAISGLSDIILSFPTLILYIVLITSIGPSLVNIVIAITLASAPSIGRIVRGLTLELRTHGYVAAAEMRGESVLFTLFLEILPNARGPLLADLSMRAGLAVVTVGTLGFLGLGLPPPDPDWGSMVAENVTMIPVYPYMALFPGLAMCSLVIGFSMLADGLEEDQ
ncbi:ABC transporter permease [Mesorhizobium sp. B2-3-4]|uniref:ABC transporter permease n=1 Tax=Mesorhizobium sp. B2-3-4 TaxID=2589959 RepID=UPI00112E4E66|nr:ABC transporter permease [Mesorhizobium sp. B2-3-4]TPM40546.1 ABC transporter permease [Mesorhizobium sp. B2-3-4]